MPHLLGPPELVADALRPYVDLGFRTIIVRLPAPYDARDDRPDRRGPGRAAPADGTAVPRVVALAGGVGGAKLAHGLQAVLAPGELTVIVNTGDDQEFHGLLVCPDHDTVLYTLAGLADRERGWGIAGETCAAAGDAGAPTASRPGSGSATATSPCTSHRTRAPAGRATA